MSEQNSTVTKLIEDHFVKTAKGIKKKVVKKEIGFDDYKKCLFSGEEQK